MSTHTAHCDREDFGNEVNVQSDRAHLIYKLYFLYAEKATRRKVLEASLGVQQQHSCMYSEPSSGTNPEDDIA